jgi:hypothetical protein
MKEERKSSQRADLEKCRSTQGLEGEEGADGLLPLNWVKVTGLAWCNSCRHAFDSRIFSSDSGVFSVA